MRKSILILCVVCLCSVLTSCKFRGIRYHGDDNINIVLAEEYALDIDFELSDDLTFTSDNDLYVSVSPNGVIFGKNIGEANITISSPHDEVIIHVTVSLFEEPTLDFGISPRKIKSLYGEPKYNFGDTIYRYGGGNDWCSFAVWQMDFFFTNDRYFESHVYLRDDLDKRIEEYLEDKFHPYMTDSTNNIVTHLYLDSPSPNEAKIIVGKQYNVGTYEDILLAYAPFDYNRRSFRRSYIKE